MPRRISRAILLCALLSSTMLACSHVVEERVVGHPVLMDRTAEADPVVTIRHQNDRNLLLLAFLKTHPEIAFEERYRHRHRFYQFNELFGKFVTLPLGVVKAPLTMIHDDLEGERYQDTKKPEHNRKRYEHLKAAGEEVELIKGNGQPTGHYEISHWPLVNLTFASLAPRSAIIALFCAT
ncbi:MAG: hypothetical protein HQL53_13505 [Magnetococcales bacterium]|nr:hypothetical protein [Magnetococcales bacterium]